MAFRALVAGLILLLAPLSPVQAVVPEVGQPSWAELDPEQQRILAPLARDWDQMEGARKQKWLAIAKRYPAMKPEERARILKRMQDWARLTPEQRAQARSRYKNLKTVPPMQKQEIKEKWGEYKELPDDEKKRLKNKAARNPAPGTEAGRPAQKKPITGLGYLPDPAVPARTGPPSDPEPDAGQPQ